ncbi:MAG: hypothetical protein AB7D36_11775 [Oscillospiraceae bacterium]
MNGKTKLAFSLAIVLALVVGIGIGSYAASGYGTSSDPLVTLSYLTDKLTPEIMAQVDEQLSDKQSELEKKFTELLEAQDSIKSDTYSVVTLSSGQTLSGKVGCEIMLRIGTATCEAQYTPGLIDASTGGSIDDGASLTTNHLYMVTIDGHGIKATASTVKVLVRGEYTIK